MITRGLRVSLLPVLCVLATSLLASDYADMRSRAVQACTAIDPSQSQSGLVFNPDGYRSYYVRSKCFQEAAIEFRDSTLCANVKERRALLSSGWGYTAARCRQLVSEGLAGDRKALESMKSLYRTGGITLSDFRLERNGNGRDFDIIPAFTGTDAYGYTLTFEILMPSGSSVLLHSSGYHLDAASNLRIYVRQSDVRQRFPGFALNRSYPVRATVTLDVGFGGQGGYWNPAFIEGVFPARERTRSIVRQITF